MPCASVPPAAPTLNSAKLKPLCSKCDRQISITMQTSGSMTNPNMSDAIVMRHCSPALPNPHAATRCTPRLSLGRHAPCRLLDLRRSFQLRLTRHVRTFASCSSHCATAEPPAPAIPQPLCECALGLLQQIVAGGVHHPVRLNAGVGWYRLPVGSSWQPCLPGWPQSSPPPTPAMQLCSVHCSGLPPAAHTQHKYESGVHTGSKFFWLSQVLYRIAATTPALRPTVLFAISSCATVPRAGMASLGICHDLSGGRRCGSVEVTEPILNGGCGTRTTA